jgi:nitroreductase
MKDVQPLPAEPVRLDLTELIRTRRSVREGYDERSVPEEVIAELATCGLSAPSSKNAQPWRLHVVERGGLLERVAGLVDVAGGGNDFVPIDPTTGAPRQWSATTGESAAVLREVPLAFFVENLGPFSGGRASVALSDQRVRENALIGYSLEMIGLGAVVQNLLLAARALGLQGVFMGDVLVAESEIQSLLGFDGDLVGVVACGYAEGLPPRAVDLSDHLIRHPTRRLGVDHSERHAQE